jgi:hypothetical protein
LKTRSSGAPSEWSAREIEVIRTMTSSARFLSLAATPTFALMALLTGALDVGPPVCSAAPGLPLNGMVVMYLLMGAFHSTPWLKLISSRGKGARLA